MTVYPLPTTGPTLTAAGLTIPSFGDTLASWQASYRNIYGQDVNLAADTQDGAWIAIQAQANFDTNDLIQAVYNGFSPTYAQGTNLSSLVKINGLQRESPTFSAAPVTIIGQAGTRITAGIVRDGFGNQWTLTPNVVIPFGGSIVSTLTCSTPGAVALASGSTTINNAGLTFVTVLPGWQSATTTSTAVLGAPVEIDSTLRQRQTISTGLPALTPAQSILATVANLPGVTGYALYENDTNATDGNGLPAHSISVVVLGGQYAAIANAINQKKNLGTGTYGTTTIVVVDPSGVPNTINFFVLNQISAFFVLGIHPLAGYLNSTGTLAISAVAKALNSLLIGENAYVDRLFAAANLSGSAAIAASGMTQAQLDALSATYNVTYIHLGTAPAPPTQADILITFVQQVVSNVANGSITLT